jgi:hypothetical protein
MLKAVMLCPYDVRMIFYLLLVYNGLLLAYRSKIKAKALNQLEMKIVMMAVFLAYKGCTVECPQ